MKHSIFVINWNTLCTYGWKTKPIIFHYDVKIQYHLEEKYFEDRYFHLQSLPQFLCWPRFHPISVTDQSPFSSCLLHFISLVYRPNVLTLPHCLLLYIFSLNGAHGVLFLSSLFSSASHSSCFVSPSKLPSYPSSQRKHSLLLLSAFGLHLHLPPLLPVWLLLSNQASSLVAWY